jgi:hypothetical protein
MEIKKYRKEKEEKKWKEKWERGREIAAVS